MFECISKPSAKVAASAGIWNVPMVGWYGSWTEAPVDPKAGIRRSVCRLCRVSYSGTRTVVLVL